MSMQRQEIPLTMRKFGTQMIDYVEAIIKCKHTPFGNIADYTDIRTGKVKQRNLEVDVKNGISNIKVRSLKQGREIKVSGNPLMFLQQHNLFGTDDLIGLMHGMFMKATELLHIKVNELAENRILNGDFILRRVDIAHNFRMPQRDCVNKVIREIGYSWFEQNRNVSIYPNQSAYLNQHSKRWTLKFYNKRQQLIASKKHLPHKAKLLDYAERFVRAELTLRFPVLKDRPICLGSGWSDLSLPQRLLLKSIRKANLNGGVKMCLTPSEIAAQSASMKRIYVSWARGDSIKELYGSANYYRTRKQFKELGIDISMPPHPSRNIEIHLADLLKEENIATFPRFARTEKLIYLPK